MLKHLLYLSLTVSPAAARNAPRRLTSLANPRHCDIVRRWRPSGPSFHAMHMSSDAQVAKHYTRGRLEETSFGHCNKRASTSRSLDQPIWHRLTSSTLAGLFLHRNWPPKWNYDQICTCSTSAAAWRSRPLPCLGTFLQDHRRRPV